MTSTETTTDPRAAFDAAATGTLAVVLDLPDDVLDHPTPCTDFTVRDLRSHLLTVYRRVAHVGRGGAPFEVPAVATDVTADGVDDALWTASEDARSVWSDQALLTRDVEHPIGVLPGAAVLATYVGELCTHAWDLGVAVGRPVDFAPDVVEVGAAASRQLLPPGTRPDGFPFAAEVPAHPDATPIERLVAWQGRDPRWGR